MAHKKADSSHTERLSRKGLISPPPWLCTNIMFEGMTGSEAYGCRQGDKSDYDLVGFAIPPKYVVFPHLAGAISGFGPAPHSFEQFQQHHIDEGETGRKYDITIFGIVKFFHLTAENNPNMIDNLFLPRRCVTKSTTIYEHLRENRKLFLSTRVYHSFRGYASSQLSKMKGGSNRSNIQRAESINLFGYDTKFGYHLVRLLLECEQILSTGDLRLDRDATTYIAIRNGEWTLERLQDWYEAKERSLEEMLAKTKVPHKVDWEAIKGVLMECLEMHYGNLSDAVSDNTREDRILNDLAGILTKYRG